jgi:hypothetical protein
MIRSHSRVWPHRLFGLGLAAVCLACALGADAQRPTAAAAPKADLVTFAEVTSRMHVSLPLIGLGVDSAVLPVSIRAENYSLEYARRVLVPAMGGSVAAGDFDGDGRTDLYVVVPGGSNHLLQNRADGTFVDVTEKAKVRGIGVDLGAVFGDFDKSGHPSLFVAGLGGLTLYHNNGDGTFTDVTAKAGLKGKAGELATSVLLVDVDNDNYLDVLVTIYTDLSAPPAKPSFDFPNDFAGAASRLYRNRHDGTFVEITDPAGLTANPGRTHMALAGDFDHKGRMDLLMLRDNKPPALFRNQGKSEFEDKTWDAGAEIWKYAYVQGQVGDFRHDGKLGAVLWSGVGNEVLVNLGDGKFEPEETLPLVYAANRAFGFHGLAADLNGDGYDDLLTVDDREKWHFIVNRAGRFEEAPFGLLAQAGSKLPEFAAMAAVQLEKRGEMQLVGLTRDGQLRIFQREHSGNSHESSPHSQSK